MGLFSPVKKHANKFRYIPRYYDPEKERREQRRRELHGTSSELDGQEYQPGQYIRTQREVRRAAQGANEGKQKMPSMMLLMLFALLVIIVYMLYPRIVEAFSTARTTPEERMQQEIEEFNPYAPITIVPNDYKEGDEIKPHIFWDSDVAKWVESASYILNKYHRFSHCV